MSKPSCSSSRWMRGASQPGSSVFMRRMSSWISSLIFGRPSGRNRKRQNSRNPARCQETTVSARTIIRALAQPVHHWRTPTQNSRSRWRRKGRGRSACTRRVVGGERRSPTRAGVGKRCVRADVGDCSQGEPDHDCHPMRYRLVPVFVTCSFRAHRLLITTTAGTNLAITPRLM